MDLPLVPLIRWGRTTIDIRPRALLIPFFIEAYRPLKNDKGALNVERLFTVIIYPKTLTEKDFGVGKLPNTLKESLDSELLRRGESAPVSGAYVGVRCAVIFMTLAASIFIISVTKIIPYKDLEAPFKIVTVNKDSAAYAAGVREGMAIVKADDYSLIYKEQMEAYLNIPVMPEHAKVNPKWKVTHASDLISLHVRKDDGSNSVIQFPFAHSSGIKLEYRQREFKPIYLVRALSYLFGINLEKLFV